ncbi:ankyrin repeat domain-containing protein [Candidatus Babeliales bacterium]|nr:ankyrin repeat domain-containing protein [Candidatus Babeliales bacterium]
MKKVCLVFFVLLSIGARVAAAGSTPLHDAAHELNVAKCQQLIKAGADVNAQDANGNTPLHILLAQLKPLKNNALDALASKTGQETLTKIDAIQTILESVPAGKAENKINNAGMSVQQVLDDALADKIAKGWAVAHNTLPGILATALGLPMPKSVGGVSDTGPGGSATGTGGGTSGATAPDPAEVVKAIAKVIYAGGALTTTLAHFSYEFDGTEPFTALGKMGRRGRAEPTKSQKDFNAMFNANNPNLLHYVAYASPEKLFTEVFNNLKSDAALDAVDSAGNSILFYINKEWSTDKAEKLAFLATKFPVHKYPEPVPAPPSGGAGTGSGVGKPKSGTKTPLKQLKKSLKALKAKLATLADELAKVK